MGKHIGCLLNWEPSDSGEKMKKFENVKKSLSREKEKKLKQNTIRSTYYVSTKYKAYWMSAQLRAEWQRERIMWKHNFSSNIRGRMWTPCLLKVVILIWIIIIIPIDKHIGCLLNWEEWYGRIENVKTIFFPVFNIFGGKKMRTLLRTF